MTATRRLSISQARRAALAAQGFHRDRPLGRVDRRHLRRAFDDMGIIQIDSVNVLVRSQELPIFARLGPHDRSLIPAATGRSEIFEYWVHEASHVPASQHRLLRWRMSQPHAWKGVNRIGSERPDLVARVLSTIGSDGPMTAGELSPRKTPKGEWWDWDSAKAALEFLFWKGEVAATRRASDFARL
ncbi:MAG: DNA glycosylase AlkZ-like family protein, partial [Ilumatobacteraceae bacterium]